MNKHKILRTLAKYPCPTVIHKLCKEYGRDRINALLDQVADNRNILRYRVRIDETCYGFEKYCQRTVPEPNKYQRIGGLMGIDIAYRINALLNPWVPIRENPFAFDVEKYLKGPFQKIILKILDKILEKISL